MKAISLCMLVSILVSVTDSVIAQKKNPEQVSLILKDASFHQLISELQSQTGYSYYYDTTAIDSIKISISIQGRSLQESLKSALPQPFEFVIDADRNVFITKGQLINTSLPPLFSAKKK